MPRKRAGDMDLIIHGGKIITADKSLSGDIGIRNGRIAAISKGLKSGSAEIFDASGMLVFPGIIDAHVHYQLPVAGTVTSEDFASGARAAACGGVTTVIDFAIQEKGGKLRDAIDKRRAEADGKAAIDYSLHAVPTDWNEKTRGEIRDIIEYGISSFKIYMVYPGLMSNDAALFEALEETSESGGMVTVHAESASVLEMLVNRYHNVADMKRYGAYCHALSRPNYVEYEAISRAITWAKETGGRLYIVHLSTAEGVDLIRKAKKAGVKVYAETCPHYLLLNDSVFKKADGHLYATCPQVKKRRDSLALWRGLADGTISVAATDSCTFTREQKDRWDGDFTKIPYGLPGAETLLPLMYTYGVGAGRLSVRKMAQVLSTNPAKLLGLYPQKGTIAIGSDADLVIFDPCKKMTISHKNLQTNCDWSPYEGFRVKGYPIATFSRGRLAARDGAPVDSKGQFIRRKAGTDL